MATGFLINQIAHETGRPLRLVFRSDDPARLREGATVTVTGRSAEHPTTQWRSWGSLWGEHWWVATLPSLDAGEYTVRTHDAAGTEWHAPLRVAPDALISATVEHVALGQLERRAKIPVARGHGWIDCGGHLSEANSHAVTVIGLCHFFERRRDALTPDEQHRLLAQIRVGAEYFLFLAALARDRGLPAGTYQHEPGGETTWLIEDSVQIGVALCLAAEVLSKADDGSAGRDGARAAATDEDDGALATRLVDAARATHAHLQERPVPPGQGFSRIAHAFDREVRPPSVWMTRELGLYLEFLLRLDALGVDTRAESGPVVEEILGRWVDPPGGDPRDTASAPPHFIPFPGVTQPEVAWCHNAVGRDTGGLFPHYVLPLELFVRAYPESPLAARCTAVVDRFLDGYLEPAAGASPFSLLPNTWKQGEGWLWFAGLWHGMNASYALMAMQLFALSERRTEPWIREMAWAQLDWIAGLNAGLTHESQWACVMSSYDVPEGIAMPVSMIYGIGRATAGSWRTIRGSICNGFSRGAQFEFDVEPRVSEDRPEAFTDEDWITHGGAWLAALAWAR